MAGGQLVKAYIYDEDHRRKVLECLFNPTDYELARSNQWAVDKLPGNNAPQVSFQGGDAMSMRFQLFFDTYGAGASSHADVRTYTEELLKLMNIDPQLKNNDLQAHKGRPPVCSFRWGDYWSFKGVFTSVSLRFTLFESDGKPVRATADVTLQQVEEAGTYPRQNPTSGGAGARASKIVQPGETLDLIAYQEYGDPTLWRHIATANGIENPRSLHAGQRLVVPSL